jgi:shikimate dehydrogenase
MLMQKRTLIGLVGTNILGSLAPALHEDALAVAGVVGHYHLMDLDVLKGRSLADILSAVRTAGFAGINVTHPFKEPVVPLLDQVSPEAREIGAVNTVVIDRESRTVGHNTDRTGFIAASSRRSAAAPRKTAPSC